MSLTKKIKNLKTSGLMVVRLYLLFSDKDVFIIMRFPVPRLLLVHMRKLIWIHENDFLSSSFQFINKVLGFGFGFRFRPGRSNGEMTS